MVEQLTSFFLNHQLMRMWHVFPQSTEKKKGKQGKKKSQRTLGREESGESVKTRREKFRSGWSSRLKATEDDGNNKDDEDEEEDEEEEQFYSADENYRDIKARGGNRVRRRPLESRSREIPIQIRPRQRIPQYLDRPFESPRRKPRSRGREYFEESPQRTRSQSRGRRTKREPDREWQESDAEEFLKRSDEDSAVLHGVLDRATREEIERERPATVRIRRERSLTEELRIPGGVDGLSGRRPVRNSIMKRSVSIDDLRGDGAGIASDLDGFVTADSGMMDDYFLDRQPFSFSALNLRGKKCQRE